MRFTTLLVLFLSVLLTGAIGCTREVAPPLVEILEVSPRALEPGDRAEIRGSGFPQGRATKIRFEGTVRRPGEGQEKVSVDTTATASSSDRIDLGWNELLVERFCGRGDRASHATFEGDLEVAFASSTPNAPPLVGVLHGVVLDIRPSSTPPAVAEARSNEGARLLAFLGIVPGTATPRGIPAEEVKRGSVAESAGVLAGDLVSSFDGVHVSSLTDIAVTSHRSATIGLRHGDIIEEETRTVSLAGYASDGIPVELVPALLVVGLALALLVVLVMPGPLWLAVLEARVAARLRGRSLRSLLGSLFGRGRAASVSAITTALVAAFALAPHLFGREVDGVVLLVACSVLLVASRAMAVRGLRARLRVTLELTPIALVLFATMVAVVALAGAMDTDELVRSQGGAPWRFAAAQKPAAAFLAWIHCAAVTTVLRTREGLRPTASSALVERVGLLAACALAVSVFFGGWQVPGAMNTRAVFPQVLGASLFVLKTWGLAALLAGAARVSAARRPSDARGAAWKRLGPALVAAAALVVLSRRVVPSAALETACGATAVVLVVLVAIRCAARVRAVLLRPEAHASPFL